MHLEHLSYFPPGPVGEVLLESHGKVYEKQALLIPGPVGGVLRESQGNVKGEHAFIIPGPVGEVLLESHGKLTKNKHCSYLVL